MPRRNLMDDAKLEEIRQRVEVFVASEPAGEPAEQAVEQAQELVAPVEPAGSRYYKWKTLRKALHAWMWHWLE